MIRLKPQPLYILVYKTITAEISALVWWLLRSRRQQISASDYNGIRQALANNVMEYEIYEPPATESDVDSEHERYVPTLWIPRGNDYWPPTDSDSDDDDDSSTEY